MAISTTSTIDISSLDGTDGFRLDGVAAGDRLGGSVSNAGDVNGDGFDDVIVGASRTDPNGNASGSSYVVFGKAAGFDAAMDLSSLDGDNGFRLDGVAADDYSGGSVSSAGDINGDGFDDVIVGAPSADPNGDRSGSSYVVFGRASGFDASMSLSDLDGSNGFRLDGLAERDFLGLSVSSAGDVNGDGFDDVIIGSNDSADTYSSFTSTIGYLVFGSDSGFSPALNLSSLDGSNGFRLDVDAYNANSTSVSSAGDINGDGFDDLVIDYRLDIYTFRSYSESYVVFGKASGFDAALDLSSLDGSDGFRLSGVQFGPYSYSGGELVVSNAGDVNGDGFDDLIVGSPSGGSSYYAGVSYVVFGRASGFGATLDLGSLNGSNGFRLDGVAERDNLGGSVSSAGDVNGDGFDDLIVGARGADPYEIAGAGASYVVFGRASGFAATMNLSSLDGNDGFRLDGVAEDDRLGRVSSAGDVNGDGFDDLLVGAPDADPNGNESGSSYVLFGSSNFTGTGTFPGTPGDDTLTGTTAAERFGAGDGNDIMSGGGGADVFNGDAGDDIIKVPDLDFHLASGGTGNDTLELTGSGIGLNLANFRGDVRFSGDNTIRDVETIDLTGSGDNTLTLTAKDVFDLSDTTDTLVVKGNEGDHVAGIESRLVRWRHPGQFPRVHQAQGGAVG